MSHHPTAAIVETLSRSYDSVEVVNCDEPHWTVTSTNDDHLEEACYLARLAEGYESAEA